MSLTDPYPSRQPLGTKIRDDAKKQGWEPGCMCSGCMSKKSNYFASDNTKTLKDYLAELTLKTTPDKDELSLEIYKEVVNYAEREVTRRVLAAMEAYTTEHAETVADLKEEISELWEVINYLHDEAEES